MTTMKNLKVCAIIAAAGAGTRANLGRNKLLSPLYGAPALYHTLKKFDLPEIQQVVVAASPKDFDEISLICKPFGYTVVKGGETRTQSVKNALNAVDGDIVLIHDGARPFVTSELIRGCINSVEKYGSGVCAVPFTDTAGKVNYGQIFGRVDRDELYCMQTPQGFFTEEIKHAYALAGDENFTDDSSVYGKYIAPPRICEGSVDNIKLTYARDFRREMPVCPENMAERTGFGVDVHAFGEGKKIVLCGVKIPFDKGLKAHSDGDVGYHAVIDALFSAAGLKDIGKHFPDGDPQWKGADSAKMLKKTLNIVAERGYAPACVSLSIQAEKPKLETYIDKMVQNIAEICKVDPSCVAVAAGTCEGLGFVGEGLGIAAYCTVFLRKL